VLCGSVADGLYVEGNVVHSRTLNMKSGGSSIGLPQFMLDGPTYWP
jgi:hypothetical protein